MSILTAPPSPISLLKQDSPEAFIGVVTSGEAALNRPYSSEATGDSKVSDYYLPELGLEVVHSGELSDISTDGRPSDLQKLIGLGQVFGVDNSFQVDHTPARIIGATIGQQLLEEVDIATAFDIVVPRLPGTFSLIVRHNADLFVARDRDGQGSMFYGSTGVGYAISECRNSVGELTDDVFELQEGTIAHFSAGAMKRYRRWSLQFPAKLN